MYKPAPRLESGLFWQTNIMVLLASAFVLYWFFPVGGYIDHWLMQPWVTANAVFPYRENWWLTRIAHNGIKHLIILLIIIYGVRYVGSFYIEKWRAYRWTAGYIFIAMLVTIGVIGLLKSHSEHACPWSLAQPGTTQVVWLTHTAKLGKCFPGGHSSAGFALMALFFAYHRQAPKKAWAYLVAAFVIGFGMGWTQMMRGAHFLSHNLWTMWLTGLMNVVMYLSCQIWFELRDYIRYAQSAEQPVIANQDNQPAIGNTIVTDSPPSAD